MTDPSYTAMLLVIDRSGSMSTIRDEMVQALEVMIAEQRKEPGLLTVDVVTFDDRIEHAVVLGDPEVVRIELEPRGATALYDAIGVAVQQFGARLAAMPEHARPSTVQVIVVTDGLENASQEWTAESVKATVERQRTEFGWDFVFLGANQDAVLTGARLGFARDASMTYAPAPGAVGAAGASMSRYMSDLRRGERRGFDGDERGSAMGAGS
ncbi:vWA domain-containing protein [Agrococcus sp. SGAir0287]|uniref:vWA domain-containing protein n=1 Tax=Agrococcus sp. SGAir0287 TaxID=2070347 RepID=UPI0010CD13DB|nr:vWA domain-containing protein [Agrococcus sp. SGAir0287]QCR20292.1 hypothetical protein C1N71_13295 [Agrococcus sp. SGAir0287]